MLILFETKSEQTSSVSQASFFYAWVLDEGDDERSPCSKQDYLRHLSATVDIESFAALSE